MSVRHPGPKVMAQYLRRVAAQLEDRGDKAVELSKLLGSRGYPTGGSGGPRSSDTTSSTERAALSPDGWVGIDDQLAIAFRAMWHHVTLAEHTMSHVLAHSSDADPIPVGRGHCDACDTFCIGDGGNNRLRGGLCHRCTEALRRYLRRYPNATRSDFITDTRRDQRDRGATSNNTPSASVSP